MSAGEHRWSGRGNGNGDAPGPCVDVEARQVAQAASDAVFEMHGLLSGMEARNVERLAVGFEMLGVKDIRRRYREMDAARKQAEVVPSVPPAREKVPSAHDIQQLADSAHDLRDAIDEASERFERTNRGTVVQVQPAKASDPPEEVVKKFGIGVLTIIFKTTRDLAIEHGLRIALGAGLLATGGTVAHYLHVWHVLK